jgi:hypothetical protein
MIPDSFALKIIAPFARDKGKVGNVKGEACRRIDIDSWNRGSPAGNALRKNNPREEQ